MAACDNCLSDEGEFLSENITLCEDCRSTQRGQDIVSLLSLYEIVESTSSKRSLAQLAFHNLLNLSINAFSPLNLNSGGVGQGELEYGVSLYWAFDPPDTPDTDYPALLRELNQGLRTASDDSVLRVPDSLHAGEGARTFSESMIQMREIVGGLSSPQQHRKVALERYVEYSDTLRELYNFDIRDAIWCVDELIGAYNDHISGVVDRNLGKSEYLQILKPALDSRGPRPEAVRKASAKLIETRVEDLNGLWVERSTIVNSLNNPYGKEFIDAMSCPVGSAKGFAVNDQADENNTIFRCPYDVRPTERNIFVQNDDQLLWPFPQRSYKVLAERFHFDLLNAASAPTYSEHQGDYVEKMAYDGLTNIFTNSDGRVLHSTRYDDPVRENPSKNPETDIVVKWRNLLLIIECKSRSLLAATRAGRASSDIIKNEVQHESGIGGAYQQAKRLISGINEDKVIELRPESEESISVDSDMLCLPVVVMGAHYEYVATGGFLPFLNIDNRPPYVVDLYSLDAILKLTSSNELIAYIIRRNTLLKNGITFFNIDELDFFAAFRMGILNIDFLKAVMDHDFSEQVTETMNQYPDTDGATFQFQIKLFLQSTGRDGEFGIREQAKEASLHVSVNSDGVVGAITLPFNHNLRFRAYPPEHGLHRIRNNHFPVSLR